MQAKKDQGALGSEIEMKEIYHNPSADRIPTKSKSLAQRRREIQKKIDQVPVVNPKFNDYRNSVLEKATHYNKTHYV